MVINFRNDEFEMLIEKKLDFLIKNFQTFEKTKVLDNLKELNRLINNYFKEEHNLLLFLNHNHQIQRFIKID